MLNPSLGSAAHTVVFVVGKFEHCLVVLSRGSPKPKVLNVEPEHPAVAFVAIQAAGIVEVSTDPNCRTPSRS
jgi:hypothetical protein